MIDIPSEGSIVTKDCVTEDFLNQHLTRNLGEDAFKEALKTSSCNLVLGDMVTTSCSLNHKIISEMDEIVADIQRYSVSSEKQTRYLLSNKVKARKHIVKYSDKSLCVIDNDQHIVFDKNATTTELITSIYIRQ